MAQPNDPRVTYHFIAQKRYLGNAHLRDLIEASVLAARSGQRDFRIDVQYSDGYYPKAPLFFNGASRTDKGELEFSQETWEQWRDLCARIIATADAKQALPTGFEGHVTHGDDTHLTLSKDELVAVRWAVWESITDLEERLAKDRITEADLQREDRLRRRLAALQVVRARIS